MSEDKGKMANPDAEKLAADIRQDRLDRRMTWPEYGEFMGLSSSTLYKIATGETTKPHDLTVNQIRKKMAEPTPEQGTAAGEVVSD